VPYLVVLVVIPVGPGDLVGQQLDAGLFFVLAVMGIGVLGTLMAGWASANKYSLLGRTAHRRAADGVRAAVHPRRVLRRHGGRHPLAAGHRRGLGAVVAALAAARARSSSSPRGWPSSARPPFDMPVADSEIIFGAYTEYTGLRFALFLLAEYAGIVVLCALTTVLFLGGWRGPFDDQLGVVWTLLKTLALAFVVIWLRVSYPRLREDQLQRFAWQGLVPLALLQLAVTGVVRVAIA
jgi:NADH-quinone oxidoreductase subunit H